MSSKPFTPTRLYIKRHIVTGKRYFGKHNGPDIELYCGSGIDWNLHLDSYGRSFVEHEWASDWFTDKQEIRSFALAFSEIFDIVESDEWLNMVPENGENSGGVKGMVTVRDKDNNYYQVPKDDPRYLSGELVHYSTGMVTVKDKDGKTCRTTVDDPRYLSGELVGFSTNEVAVQDQEGNIFRVPKDDPRWLSGKLVHPNKGLATVKDKSGNIFRVPKDDPRLLLGELVGHCAGKKLKTTTCDRCGFIGSAGHMGRHQLGPNCKKAIA